MLSSWSLISVENGKFHLVLINLAKFVGIYADYSDIFIPRSIKRGLKEYTIIGIKESSFEKLLMMESIHFAINKDIRIIEKNAFCGSNLTSITIPPNVSTICDKKLSM